MTANSLENQVMANNPENQVTVGKSESQGTASKLESLDAGNKPENLPCKDAPEVLAELEAQLPPLEFLSDLADLYKMFGDSTRLQILSALRLKELCVGDLADLLKMTPSAISHQLRTLRAQNLVTYRREGKMSYYSLADEHVEIIIDMGLEHIQEE